MDLQPPMDFGEFLIWTEAGIVVAVGAFLLGYTSCSAYLAIKRNMRW